MKVSSAAARGAWRASQRAALTPLWRSGMFFGVLGFFLSFFTH